MKNKEVSFLTRAELKEDQKKKETEDRVKKEVMEKEAVLKAKHNARFAGTTATSVTSQITAYSTQAKTNKSKEIATLDEYKSVLWDTLQLTSQVKV